MSIDGQAAIPPNRAPKEKRLLWALPRAALVTVAFVVTYKAFIRSMPTTSAIAVFYVICVVSFRAGYTLFSRRRKGGR